MEQETMEQEMEEDRIYIPDTAEQINERLKLAWEGIEGLSELQECSDGYREYFEKQARFALMIREHAEAVSNGSMAHMGINELRLMNRELYADIMPEHYAESFANPDYCASQFGREIGQLMAYLAAEMRVMTGCAYEQDNTGVVIRLELLLEIYGIFRDAERDGIEIQAKYIKSAMYWFVSDYAEYNASAGAVKCVDTDNSFFTKLISDADLSDHRYLFMTGEYISDSIERTADHIAEFPEEKVKLIADTFTEGYRIGFKTTNKDMSKVRSVCLYGQLGFERIYRRAVENFSELGLMTTVFRGTGHNIGKSGMTGANPNKQFDFDHREDMALFLDGKLVTRMLEGLKAVFEAHRQQAAVYGGPAVLEVFGEKDFEPETKQDAPAFNDEQRRLEVAFSAKSGMIWHTYIKSEHRSFTIISFPVPEIGFDYKEIFDETVRINTLDYRLYQNIQQKLVDALDKGEYAEVKGCGGNMTELRIRLHSLSDPSHQSNFENCVADVNIPVGEVFTSPVLEGTEGLLHVKRVFINGLEYRDLKISIKDGMVTDYSCADFPKEEDNRKLISDNIMFHHETLPMGEFAIGTNTTAFVVARKYNIESKLDILIAEKTGPHFAFGDTCYSHEEEIKTWNPDGKELIAKSNTVSDLRDKDPEKAYFNCHTDITIPYDELGSIEAVAADGSRTAVIENGRFVLPGTEELNRPFDI